jgi:peptide/nickel transport system substrate-binding protein
MENIMDKILGRKSMIAFFIMISLAIAISGCLSNPTYSSNTSTSSANFSIVVMEPVQPQSLDPAFCYGSGGLEIDQNVYQTLLFYNGSSTSDLVGMLAKSFTVSPDGLNYTFYLRDNVNFSDGTAFNASAVKYSFDRGLIMNQPSGSFSNDITPFLAGGREYMHSNQTPADVANYLAHNSVQVINDTTVVFHLAKPYSAFPYALTWLAASIISPSYDQAHGGYKANNQSGYMLDHTCGTGPFMLTEWENNDHITLTRNPDYWGTPVLPSQVIIRYADDYNTRLMAVDSGEADILMGSLVMHYNDLKNDSNIKLDVNPVNLDMHFIGLNTNMTPFDNKLVRQAFVESFDYDTYINKVLNGLATQPNGPVPQGVPGYNASIPKNQFNPSHAKQLLQQAGFNSIHPLKITLYHGNGEDSHQTACMLLKQKIESYDPSYSVDVQALDWPIYIQKQQNRQLPIYIDNWIADFASADNFIGPFYLGTSQGCYAPQLSYNNTEINDIYLSALYETNLTKQLEGYNRIITLGQSDYVYIFTAQPYLVYAYRPDVHGIVKNTLISGYLYSTIYKEVN